MLRSTWPEHLGRTSDVDSSQRFGGEVRGFEVFGVGWSFNLKEVNMSTPWEQGDVEALLLSLGSGTAFGASGLDDETAAHLVNACQTRFKVRFVFFVVAVTSNLVKTLISFAS